MSDPQDPEQRPEFPAAGVSLGGLGAGEVDRTLKASPGEGATAPEPPADAPLALPRGALVAFRKSGGMRFTSRGIVIYRTGWVVPLEGTSGRPRHITAEALDALAHLILRSGIGRVQPTAGRPRPDGYGYELAAVVGGRIRHVTVDDGAIPPDLERLIRVLQRLMPRE